MGGTARESLLGIDDCFAVLMKLVDELADGVWVVLAHEHDILLLVQEGFLILKVQQLWIQTFAIIRSVPGKEIGTFKGTTAHKLVCPCLLIML